MSCRWRLSSLTARTSRCGIGPLIYWRRRWRANGWRLVPRPGGGRVAFDFSERRAIYNRAGAPEGRRHWYGGGLHPPSCTGRLIDCFGNPVGPKHSVSDVLGTCLRCIVRNGSDISRAGLLESPVFSPKSCLSVPSGWRLAGGSSRGIAVLPGAAVWR